jgi:hypothetical protein
MLLAAVMHAEQRSKLRPLVSSFVVLGTAVHLHVVVRMHDSC